MNKSFIKNGEINDVKLYKINDYSDESGSLSVLMSQDREDAPDSKNIREVYVVDVHKSNSVRGNHKHLISDEFFIIIEGSARFYLLDDRDDSSTKGLKETFEMFSDEMHALFVPRGIYHAFKTLSDRTKCLAFSNNPFDKSNPDQFDISPALIR